MKVTITTTSKKAYIFKGDNLFPSYDEDWYHLYKKVDSDRLDRSPMLLATFSPGCIEVIEYDYGK